MMRGSEVDTTVPERIATNMPRMSPEMALSVARRDMGACAVSGTTGVDAVTVT
ncbi:hypothetical protein GCM10025877_21730 [Agromyces mangrovi Wang et al. 2018]|nr:hypothetical protein GCM10025877_21730 [Agromyces mangrovi]